jgi:hypothetical protein
MNYLKHYCGKVPSREEYSILTDGEYDYMIQHQYRENRKMMFFSFGFFIFVCVFFPIFIACLSLSGNRSCKQTQPVQAAQPVQATQPVQAAQPVQATQPAQTSCNDIYPNNCVYRSSRGGGYFADYEVIYKDAITNQVKIMIINLPPNHIERDKLGGGVTFYPSLTNLNETIYLPHVISIRKL